MPNPSTRRPLTPAQRDIMATLTSEGNGAPVTISTGKLAQLAGVTVKQAEQAINGLMDASTLTKSWDPDRYVWTYTLNAPLAGN
jgi:hypothetical protein